jgi:hypothetical protein
MDRVGSYIGLLLRDLASAIVLCFVYRVHVQTFESVLSVSDGCQSLISDHALHAEQSLVRKKFSAPSDLSM